MKRRFIKCGTHPFWFITLSKRYKKRVTLVCAVQFRNGRHCTSITFVSSTAPLLLWYTFRMINLIDVCTMMCAVMCMEYSTINDHHTLIGPYYATWNHDDVIKRKHFPRYWSPVNSPHKGQWRGAVIFSLICVWINGWVNNHKDCDLRRHRAHYDATLMYSFGCVSWINQKFILPVIVNLLAGLDMSSTIKCRVITINIKPVYFPDTTLVKTVGVYHALKQVLIVMCGAVYQPPAIFFKT